MVTRAIYIGLVVLLTISLTGCTGKKEPSIRIGTNVWPGYEPLYLAKNLGILSDHEVKLVEHTSASQVIRAFRNEALDAAALTLDEVLILAEDGFKPKIAFVMDVSNGADAIVARSEISNMSQLRGKRVGAEVSALGAYMLTRALEISGMNLSDLDVQGVEYGRHEQAFKEEGLDAIVTFEPVKSKLIKEGGHVVFDSTSLPGEIVDVLIVREEYLQTHPDQVRALIAGWYKTLIYMNEHWDDAMQRTSQRMQLSPEETRLAYEGLELPDQQQNDHYLRTSAGDPALIKPATKLATLMRSRGLLKSEININALFIEEEFYRGK